MSSILLATGVGAAVSLIGGIFGSSAAKKRERAARRAKIARQKELARLEANRQSTINPYVGASDLSGMAKDLSGEVSNPYANLKVATKAAEMQTQEADIALANTLDTIRATGGGAGGATALAQMALKSKQGVSASIEQQEAQNAKLQAQGQQHMEAARMSEKQRVQGVQISEGQRMQDADAKGQMYEWEAKESRETAKMNRVAGYINQEAQKEVTAQQDSSAAWAGAISGVASSISAGIGASGEVRAAEVMKGTV